MELFAKLYSSLLVFVYHCFDRIVIHGYLSGLSRPEQVVYFFRDVIGVPVVDKAALSKRTGEYRSWVGTFAHNHHIPMEWAQKGVRKEDYVRPYLRRMERASVGGGEKGYQFGGREGARCGVTLWPPLGAEIEKKGNASSLRPGCPRF